MQKTTEEGKTELWGEGRPPHNPDYRGVNKPPITPKRLKDKEYKEQKITEGGFFSLSGTITLPVIPECLYQESK